VRPHLLLSRGWTVSSDSWTFFSPNVFAFFRLAVGTSVPLSVLDCQGIS
jgi:hypothetical protein